MKNKLLNARRLNTYILPFLRLIIMVGSVFIAVYAISGAFNIDNITPIIILCGVLFLVAAISKQFLDKWKKRTDFLIDNFEDTAKYSHKKGKMGEYDEDGDLNIGLMLKRGSSSALEDLNKLIGLTNVKNEVLKMKSVYEYEAQHGKNTETVARHMAFLGNPGCGKTEVASIFSGLLYQYGRIKQNMYLQCTGNDLTGEFSGQTKAKVNAIFKRCEGGVLFIDEAYILGQAGNDALAAEAIAQLLVHMESARDTVVIFAGYTNEMKQFIDINPGLASRIGVMIEFPDYTADELIQITKKFMNKKEVVFSPEAEETLKRLYQAKINRHDKNFSNGRYARNCFNEIYQQHALLYQMGSQNGTAIAPDGSITNSNKPNANVIVPADIMTIAEKLILQS